MLYHGISLCDIELKAERKMVGTNLDVNQENVKTARRQNVTTTRRQSSLEWRHVDILCLNENQQMCFSAGSEISFPIVSCLPKESQGWVLRSYHDHSGYRAILKTPNELGKSMSGCCCSEMNQITVSLHHLKQARPHLRWLGTSLQFIRLQQCLGQQHPEFPKQCSIHLWNSSLLKPAKVKVPFMPPLPQPPTPIKPCHDNFIGVCGYLRVKLRLMWLEKFHRGVVAVGDPSRGQKNGGDGVEGRSEIRDYLTGNCFWSLLSWTELKLKL